MCTYDFDWITILFRCYNHYLLCGSVLEYIIKQKQPIVWSEVVAADTLFGNGVGG